MRADLHIHTHDSDGLCTPGEIARMALEGGVDLIAMTDHDTMGDLSKKRAACSSSGVRFVAGWEISAYSGETKVHVLGYRCKEGPAYAAFLKERQKGAVLRARDMIEKANAFLKTDVTYEECAQKKVNSDAPIHTMHVVRTFAEKLSCDAGQLYKELFSAEGPAFSLIGRPTPFDAVETIHACGGIASIAHPGRIELAIREREALIASLIGVGLDGIECFHSDHTVLETEYFAGLAKRYGLLVTGGSDFHAEGCGRAVGQPPFYADDRLLSALFPADESE